MIRTIKRYLAIDGETDKEYVEIACNSSDAKPDNVITGSIAVEVNTGDVYFYDESNGWVKQFSFKG